MKPHQLLTVLLPCLLYASPALPADDSLETPPEPVTEDYTPPPEILDQEQKHLPEPEVRIIKRKDATVEEYRINGRLRYAKITPSVGPAYYMVDTDGDGELDTRHNDLVNPPVQQWILYQW